MSSKLSLLISTSLLVLASASAPASANSKLILFQAKSTQARQSSGTPHQTVTPAVTYTATAIHSGQPDLLKTNSVHPVILPLHPFQTDLTSGGTKANTFILTKIAPVSTAAVNPAATSFKPLVRLIKDTPFPANGSPGATFQPVIGFPKTSGVTLTSVPHSGLLSDLHKLVGPTQTPTPMVNLVQAHQLSALSQSYLKTNGSGAVSKANIDQFIGLNRLAGREQLLTGAIGQAKFQTLLGDINHSIASGEFKIVPIVSGNTPSAPSGNNGTIVIDQSENGKTVYVPASQLSGPDNRTIDVNCKDCKVVIVGDDAAGGSSTDDRKIVVNGSGDKIVAKGDDANGAAGKSGGQITDNRQIVVDGNHDKVSAGGDEANGGSGGLGQGGGNGGTVTDDRSVVVEGNGDKVKVGTDQATGGNGGVATSNASNGGNGGTVNDNRNATINGNGSSVSLGGSNVDGGNGGLSPVGSNGGNGGTINDQRNINDNGFWNGSHYGNDQANGGNGGSS